MRKKWESCVRKDLTIHGRNLRNTITAKGPTEKTKGQQDIIGTGKESTTAALRADQHVILRDKTGIVPFKISAAVISTNRIYNSAPFLFKVYTYTPIPPFSSNWGSLCYFCCCCCFLLMCPGKLLAWYIPVDQWILLIFSVLKAHWLFFRTGRLQAQLKERVQPFYYLWHFIDSSFFFLWETEWKIWTIILSWIPEPKKDSASFLARLQ